MMHQYELFYHAYQGALLGDALAMPVHWYYDTALLDRDYGEINSFKTPKNPHPNSILWRSMYGAGVEEILHNQAQYWGKPNIHYHQNLKAGENTINYKLGTELYNLVTSNNVYNPEQWLEHYVAFMRDPNKQNDTYVEEYHRAFFERRAQSKPLLKCGIRDEHIGGISQVPALIAGLTVVAERNGELLDREFLRATVKTHVALTHKHSNVLRAADCLCRLLWALSSGIPLKTAIQTEAGDWFSCRKAESWLRQEDRDVIGGKISPACYIDQAFPASLYLSLKYQNDYFGGIKANAEVGGDNCHRAAVVGSLLAISASESFLKFREQSKHRVLF